MVAAYGALRFCSSSILCSLLNSSPKREFTSSATCLLDAIFADRHQSGSVSPRRSGRRERWALSDAMSHDEPLRECNIIFPSAHHSIHTTLLGLKRNNLSVKNRLRSIAHDARFVKQVAAHFALPLVANERCGSWYIDPSDKAGSAYFKSTDGHFGQWSFSLRRLNIHVLDLVSQHGGYVRYLDCLIDVLTYVDVSLLTAHAVAKVCPTLYRRPYRCG